MVIVMVILMAIVMSATYGGRQRVPLDYVREARCCTACCLKRIPVPKDFKEFEILAIGQKYMMASNELHEHRRRLKERESKPVDNERPNVKRYSSDLQGPVCYSVWQKNWDAEGANKLHEVLPNLGEDLQGEGKEPVENGRRQCVGFGFVCYIHSLLLTGRRWISRSALRSAETFPLRVRALSLAYSRNFKFHPEIPSHQVIESPIALDGENLLRDFQKTYSCATFSAKEDFSVLHPHRETFFLRPGTPGFPANGYRGRFFVSTEIEIRILH
ncbi:hypothetical protein PoB_000428000 [Plakobranchus ocellatus]|uniref:Uncharacterized protein n=1 Tax=Plakobranchus ocellatus TaxID=259542 RepID=A0AAV3Y4R1_9GAST|nr:hypothetical protein PoB_000428000 [Plakobranchus ocellatus]